MPDRARAAQRCAALWLSCLGAACAAASYSPCPVELPHGVPPHAFAVCREELARRFGSLAIVDETGFRLQTEWAGRLGETAQRRASVFRDGSGLAVVVEARWVHEPLVGVPGWTAPRGDAAAERELADALREAISK